MTCVVHDRGVSLGAVIDAKCISPDMSSMEITSVVIEAFWDDRPSVIASSTFSVFSETAARVLSVLPRNEAFASGGCKVMFIVENLFTTSIVPTLVSEVLVKFGAKTATVDAIQRITDARFEITVRVPQTETACTVSASVTLVADATVTATYDFVYLANPDGRPNLIFAKPELSDAGENMRLTVNNFQQIENPSEMTVLFNTVPATVRNVEFTTISTSAELVIPPVGSSMSVVVSVYHTAAGPASDVTFAFEVCNPYP